VATAIRYGTTPGRHTSIANGTNYTYPDGDFDGTLHTGIMTVAEGQRYYYSIVQVNGGGVIREVEVVSKEYTFTYRPNADSIRFLSYGDMGVKNSVGSVALMNKEAAAGGYDLTVNVGDTSCVSICTHGTAHLSSSHRGAPTHTPVPPGPRRTSVRLICTPKHAFEPLRPHLRHIALFRPQRQAQTSQKHSFFISSALTCALTCVAMQPP
jgi:hypothetical protein